MSNRLFYGDNLNILREHVADESVDLIYLDPPFNSKRDYNLLFKTPKGHESDAQITAFEDTWHWGEQAEAEFRGLQKQANTDVAQVMQALRDFLGENDMMAYLTMMANRLLEMNRVLKPTGSLYLHCDPTASHYLKIVLDGVFGAENFRNEVIWKRQSAHSDAKNKYASITDTILFYVRSSQTRFNVVRVALDEEYVSKFYHHKDHDGRLYRLSDMSAPEGGGMAAINKKTGKSNGWYEWRGYQPPERGWRFSPETMQKLHDESRLYYPEDKTKRIQLKRYLDENEGAPVSNLWDDIQPLHGAANEGLGYPTQKPLALLERIIQASSNEGDTVLDPFCGCGTAVHAAQNLKRNWIGIDITHLAVSLIEKRMKSAFPYLQAVSPGTKKAAQAGANAFEVVGVPRDFDAARDMFERDPHQFQLWACTLTGAQPYKGGKKGADQGIDGLIFPETGKGKTEKIVVSVKGGKNVGAAMVRDLKGTVEREKAAIGLFVTLAPATKEMTKEAASAGFYESPHHGAFPKIQILTIEGLLDGSERAKFPDMAMGGQTFKKAKAESKKSEQKGLF
jgi:site-specific DNA-methyltransferase (adenine-specific)